MSKTNITAIRQSIVAITRALSDKGVEVTQTGNKAFVESDNGIPKRVNIPYMPESATDELIAAVNGFLDHEVARLLYTDFKVSSNKDGKMNQTSFQIYNVIEDIRVETEMRKRFRGSKKNLDSVSGFFLEKFTLPELTKASEAGDTKAVQSVLFVPAFRAWSGQEIFADFMDSRWVAMQPIKDKIEHLIDNISKVKSTQASVDLAIEIYAALKSDEEGDSGDSGDTDDDSGEGDADAKDSDEPSEDESETETSKTETGGDDDSEGEETDEDQDKGEAEDEDADSEDESEGESEKTSSEHSEDSGDSDADGSEQSGDEPQDEGVSSEGEDDSDPSESDSDVAPDEKGEAPDTQPPEKTSMPDIDDLMEGMKDYDDAVADEISDSSADAISDSQYAVYTEDEDVVEPFKVNSSSWRDEYLEDLEKNTKKMTGPLQKTIERLVIAKTNVRNLPGKTSGRVNPSSLYRLKTGDSRVFRQKEEGQSKDVAVSLVVDCSGSMYWGDAIETAMQSAYALSSVLSKLNISNEVIGFTTREPKNYEKYWKEVHQAEAKMGISYGRTEPIYMPIFKSFDERLGVEQKKRMAYGCKAPDYLRNNVDGESIAIAAGRLSMRGESAKQMFVLSDGRPSAAGDRGKISRHLKKVVKDIASSGINIMGIGIRSHAVDDYYQKKVVIDDVEQLPSLIMSELKNLLV